MSDVKAYEIPRAVKLNAKLRIDQISLFALHAQHVHGMEQPKLGFTSNFDPIQWAKVEGAVIGLFPLTVDVEHVEGERRVKLAKLHVTTRLIYACEPSFDDADTEYVPDFLALTGWMHAWPYARADIHALSSRLGFPALVLPVLLAGQTAGVTVLPLPPVPAQVTPPSPTPPAAPTPKPARKRAKRSR